MNKIKETANREAAGYSTRTTVNTGGITFLLAGESRTTSMPVFYINGDVKLEGDIKNRKRV
ncbi:MAG: hypothetical protein ABSF80_04410 [Chitinispirillaceae bacterium]|jgi:hypothetical protein